PRSLEGTGGEKCREGQQEKSFSSARTKADRRAPEGMTTKPFPASFFSFSSRRFGFRGRPGRGIFLRRREIKHKLLRSFRQYVQPFQLKLGTSPDQFHQLSGM